MDAPAASLGESKMRPVIVKTLAVCALVAVAPWLTGGQEPLGLLISGFALLLGALLAWRQPLMRRLERGPLVVLYWLLIGLAGLSLFWTASRYSTTVWLVQWVMVGLVFRLTYSISSLPLGRKWVINGYLASAGIFCVVAIGIYLTSEYGRLTGTFYWANPAAAYLIPAVLVGLDRMRRSAGRAQWLWSAYLVLAMGSFLLTDSRAATAVLLVVLVVYLAISKLNKTFWIHFLFSTALAYGLSIGLAQLSAITAHHTTTAAPGSRFGEALKGESSSGSDRIVYLESAMAMWADRPWTGVGAGAYGDVHPQYQQRVVSASTSAHNAYVQIWAELGIAGAALLLVLLALLGWGALRGLVQRPDLMPVALGAVAILLHAGLDIDARYPALLGLVGMFLGLIYVQRSEKWVKPSWRWPAVAALVLVPVISLFLSATWAARGQAAQADNHYELAADDFAQAGSGLIFNPDVVGAEGINVYAQAATGDAKAGQELAQTALALAQTAQRLDPADGQHYQLEGRVQMGMAKYVAAEAAFRRALQLDPYNHPDYALDLARALAAQGRQDEAVRVVGAMLAQYPPAVVANRVADESLRPLLANLEVFVGNVYLKAGRLDEARAATARAVALDPKGLGVRALKHQIDSLR